MSAAQSCESVTKYHEPCNNSKSKTSKKPLVFSAVTIKLNTAPWKPNGVTNEETIAQILYALKQNCRHIGPHGHLSYIFQHPPKWELDSKCQLHAHATIQTVGPIYRNKAIAQIKETLPHTKPYAIYIKTINSSQELAYWRAYCEKTTFDPRPLYYRICAYYHSKPRVIEDFSDLADYDVEYNSKTRHFEYIDSSKVKLFETNY